MSEPSTHKRPFGVTVIVILQLITLVSLISDLVLEKGITLIPLFPGVRESVLLLPASGAAIGFYQLVVTFGLWRLKRWAWFLIMIQLGIGMSFVLWSYFSGFPLYSYMVFNMVMVFYLNQHDVQLAFEHRSKSQEVGPWTT